MGYHASIPYVNQQYLPNSNTSENDILSDTHFAIIPPPQPGKYFLSTGKEPMCQRHYRFTIELAKPRVAEHWVQGKFTFSTVENLQYIICFLCRILICWIIL